MNTDTTPTVEAERSLIGAALLNVDSVRTAIEHVTPTDFHDVVLGQLYALIIGMRAVGDPVDVVTLAAAANERSIKGVTPSSLFQLLENTPTAANAGHYARIVAESATKRRLLVAGTRIAQAAASTVSAADAMTVARDAWKAAVDGAPTSALTAVTLGELLAGESDYDWVIPGLLERQDRLVLTGGEGAGKSTFVRQLVIAASAGINPITFETITPVKTLVIDAENSDTQWRRKADYLARHAARHGSVDPRESLRLSCVARLDVTTERHLSAVHTLIDEHQPDVVAIGPLYKLVPRAINSDDDAAPLIDALDSIRARGVALVMEAHAGHAMGGDGQRDLRPRGSAAILGWPEFGMGLRVNRDDGHVADLVRWRGDRDERAWPNALRRGTSTGWPWADAATHQPAWSPSGNHDTY